MVSKNLKVKVLVTAVGGDIGQGVVTSLSLSSYPIKVIGMDMDYDSPGVFHCDVGYIVPPVKKKQAYLEKLIAICKDEKIDIAFVCAEQEQRLIAQRRAYLASKLKTHFIVQPLRVVVISEDKAKMHKELVQKGIRTPSICLSLENIHAFIRTYGFPIILKPRCGRGSKNVFIVKNVNELKVLWNDVPQLLAQQYIGNKNEDEYTVGVFLGADAKARGAIVMKRKLRFGVTWHAIADEYPDIAHCAIQAAEGIGAIGPCNVQLRSGADGELYVIEINARLSSTSVFRSKLGFNEPEACITHFLYKREPALKYRPAVIMRTWGDTIIPLKYYESIKKNGVIKINQK